jgi:hypothetical protein
MTRRREPYSSRRAVTYLPEILLNRAGWRKLGMFFGVCYEIKDFKDETDQHGGIVRSKFWVKAIMP